MTRPLDAPDYNFYGGGGHHYRPRFYPNNQYRHYQDRNCRGFEYQHPHARMFSNHQSPFGSVVASPLPYMNDPGAGDIVGATRSHGFSSPYQMTSSGGIDMRACTGTFGQPPSPRGQSAPFGFSSTPRAHSRFPLRYPRQSFWGRPRRRFDQSRFPEDDNTEDRGNFGAYARFPPLRRIAGFSRYARRPMFRMGERPDWYEDYATEYAGFRDYDEDDDVNEFDLPYYP